MTETFDAYIERTRDLMPASLPEAVVEQRLPFETGPADATRNALLIHGLLDTPFVMRDIARRLDGYRSRAILLPGHGTVPDDMLRVDYRDWIAATRDGVESFGAGEPPVLVGFSTGAGLALHYALSAPVRALVLISPGVRARNSKAWATCWVKHLGLVSRRFAWASTMPDDDTVKYESFAWNAACQFYLLTRALAKAAATGRLTAPVFIAVSADDATIDADAALRFFESHAPEGSRLIWYAKRPEPPSADPRIEVRTSAYPKQRILDFAHVGLANAPDNPHYGADGDYVNCLHYRGDEPAWAACRAPDNRAVWYGEVSEANLEKAKREGCVLRRLTYNPDFDGMMDAVSEFLEGVA